MIDAVMQGIIDEYAGHLGPNELTNYAEEVPGFTCRELLRVEGAYMQFEKSFPTMFANELGLPKLRLIRAEIARRDPLDVLAARLQLEGDPNE